MVRNLLIDADLMAYRASSACQKNYDWGDGVKSVSTDIDAAKSHLKDLLDGWMHKLDGDKLTICLSDDFDNFRKDVDPTYKQSRGDTERPIHLYELKTWLSEQYPFVRYRRLEADDVMGIMATEPSDEERIIVSQDKDMKTIPGWLYRPFSDNPKLEEITLEAADRFHLYQTLIGDAVDGFPGCPGMGPVAAAKHLDGKTGFEDYQHEFKAGPRKGLTETRWREVPMDNPWDIVVSLYRKAGKTAKDALVQARLARILRHGEHRNWVPILWVPGS